MPRPRSTGNRWRIWSGFTAKARYLAVRGDLSSTPAAVARAKMTWQQLEARKTAIIARMVALEELEQMGVPEQLEVLEQDAA